MRPKNRDVRPREYLTEAEVGRLIGAAAKLGRNGHRDATMILVAFRHGLRACELVGLARDQVFPAEGVLHVNRAKGGIPSSHPLSAREIRALNRLMKGRDARHVFVSERGGPMTVSSFQKIVARAGAAAGFDFPVHPHMLRHACGYKLANDGRDTRAIQHYLGHRKIEHTVRYTELRADRFRDFWGD